GLCAALHGALAGAWAPSEIAGWLYARIASTLAPTEGQGRRVENRVAFSTESPNTQRTLITQRRVALWEKVARRYTLALIFCTGPVHATSRRTLAAGEIQRLCRYLQPAGAVPDSSRAEMGGAGGYGRNLALSGCGHLELLRAVLAAAVGQAGRCHRRVRDPGRFAEHHRIEILQALPDLAESVGVREP